MVTISVSLTRIHIVWCTYSILKKKFSRLAVGKRQWRLMIEYRKNGGMFDVVEVAASVYLDLSSPTGYAKIETLCPLSSCARY
jgi:hypothetical protein